MLPQYYGEYFVFGIVSDKLEQFESCFMSVRNWLTMTLINLTLNLTRKAFSLLRYVPNSKLSGLKDEVLELERWVKKEELHRSWMKSNQDWPPQGRKTYRDSVTMEMKSRRIKKASTNIYTPVGTFTSVPEISTERKDESKKHIQKSSSRRGLMTTKTSRNNSPWRRMSGTEGTNKTLRSSFRDDAYKRY